MSQTTVEVTENGPYKLTGPVSVLDHAGQPVETPEGKAIFLCRCGGSTNKPFCDGTHSKIGFDGAARAVAEAESGAGA